MRCVAFSPDGKTIGSASNDKTVKLWSIVAGKCLRTMLGHTGSVCSVAFSKDNKTIASASNDKSVKLWNIGTGDCLKTLEGHAGSV